MELVSIIVPIYKTEKFLDQCIQSIVNQTYRQIEIILVDDGSPDRCSEICNTWALKDNRVHVVHKKNGGGAQSRNFGLKCATGDYIAFVDSDDIIHPKMLETLISVIDHYKSDIAECSYTTQIEDFAYEDKKATENKVGIFNSIEAMNENIEDKILRQIVWNKIYKTSIIGDIRFIEGKYIDDEFFTYRVLANCSKAVVIKDKLYFYRQQENSVMNSKFSLKRLDAVEAKVARLEFVKKEMPELEIKARINLVGTCIYMGQMALAELDRYGRKEAFQILNKVIADNPLKREDICGQKTTHKIWLLLSQKSIFVTCFIRNILKVGV